MNELIQIGPISPLRQRLIDDTIMRRFSKETQRNYLRDVGRFATWLGRSPYTANTEDIRQFQIEQRQAGVPVPTMNNIVAALRFFCTHTLDRPDLARKLICTAHARKIPVVLTMAEVKRLLRFGPRRRGDCSRLVTAWWALTGSNRRPSRCKRDALPTELSAPIWEARPCHSFAAVASRASPSRRKAKDSGRAIASPQLSIQIRHICPPRTRGLEPA